MKKDSRIVRGEKAVYFFFGSLPLSAAPRRFGFFCIFPLLLFMQKQLSPFCFQFIALIH